MASLKSSYRETELGLEKRCACCGDYWPADPEFFHLKANGLATRCRACVNARRLVRRSSSTSLAGSWAFGIV